MELLEERAFGGKEKSNLITTKSPAVLLLSRQEASEREREREGQKRERGKR